MSDSRRDQPEYQRAWSSWFMEWLPADAAITVSYLCGEIESLRATVAALKAERDTWRMRAEEAEELVTEYEANGSDELRREHIAAMRICFRIWSRESIARLAAAPSDPQP